MRFRFRSLAAITVAVVLTFPVAAAGPGSRDRDRDLSDRLARVIQKFQKLFNIVAHDNQPLPPRP